MISIESKVLVGLHLDPRYSPSYYVTLATENDVVLIYYID